MKTIKMASLALLVIAGTVGKTLAQSEESRSVSGFNGVATGGSFTVHVKINGSESCKLKGDAADLRKIETVVEHGVLQVRLPHEYRNDRLGHIDVFITAKSLSSVALGGSGSIDVEGVVKGDKVKVATGGSGTITTAVESSDLNVSIAGSGNISLKGTAHNSSISVAGSGSLKASDLKVDDADISIAGSGDVRMDIEKTVSAHIAGSGNVAYTGNATIGSVFSAGSGRVTRIK